jgi:hypothetical protein
MKNKHPNSIRGIQVLLMLILTHLLSVGSIKAQPAFEYLHTYADNIFDPTDFIVLDENTLLISDNKINYPVYLLDMLNDEITAQISYGKGPGELSNRYKNIFHLNDEVFIWDSGNQVLNIYDQFLNYSRAVTFSSHGYIYSVLPIDKTTFLLINSSSDIESVCR